MTTSANKKLFHLPATSSAGVPKQKPRFQEPVLIQKSSPGTESILLKQHKSRIDETMDSRLTFDQIAIGQSWTSPSRTITETDVVNFANITGDQNPLHIDHEFARSTPYRQPIAHGLLGLSWVAGLGSHSPAVDTVAFIAIKQWEFCRPIFFGDTVHVRTTVLDKQADARRNGRVNWRQELLNQHGEVTQQGVFETLVRVGNRPARAAGKPHFKNTDSEVSQSSNASRDPGKGDSVDR